MKFSQKKIVKVFSAAIFALALLLPTAVKFAHTFEGHEHKTCTELSTHIHQKQLDCSICDFHFSNFNFTPQELPDFAVIHSYQKTETFYLLPEFKLSATHYFLRGPPLYS